MKNKTIKKYENLSTDELKDILKKYETLFDTNDKLILSHIYEDINCDNLRQVNDDLDIDIHIIRMELNKRLWNNEF